MNELYPLRLSPSFREKIWGSTNLEPLFQSGELPEPPAGKNSSARAGKSRIGEIWYSFEENTITNGPLAGVTLGELMAREGARLMGSDFRPSQLRRRSAGEKLSSSDVPEPANRAYFPLLVKFLFTSDKLSVQVHPDDAYALEHEGGPGKTEMWYVLRADPGAAIALGLTEALTREQLREAALSGEIAGYLNWIPVAPGDAIFCPPGTLHSIGPGLALCEVQQNSDLTYRFYDFERLGEDGRPRPLHIERALDVTRLDDHPGPERPETLGLEDFEGEHLITCDYFTVERLCCRDAFSYKPDPERMRLIVVLKGRGTLGDEPYRTGDVFLISAALPAFRWLPAEPTELLRTYVP